MIDTSTDILVVVDMQHDFVDGSLAVGDARSIIPIVNNLMKRFYHVVATRDWHPSNHSSFSANGGIWPVHCVAGTPGSEFASGLDLSRISAVFHKGMDANVESYSAICDANENVNSLSYYIVGQNEMQGRSDMRVFVCGLATDYCVKSTAVDLSKGVETYIIIDACKSVDLRYSGHDIQGVKLITSDQL